jgi:hypothetical protein
MERSASYALPSNQPFGGGSDIDHQIRRGLQVPIGMSDIGVAQEVANPTK